MTCECYILSHRDIHSSTSRTHRRSIVLQPGRKRVDGKFLGPGGMVPASQAVCSSLLEECFEIVQEIRAQDKSKNVASSLRPIYDRLSEIRRELEQLVRPLLLAFGEPLLTSPPLLRYSHIGGVSEKQIYGITASVCRRSTRCG